VYDVEQPYKGEVYHFDCYRLKDIREAMDFGAEEYLYSGNYCFIEWPEKVEALLPEDTVRVKIEVRENGERSMIIS
ncbi:MAG: tRNA (adenosine(37)-N6)-threonylcarbamoyltransferase complex ATPase subunit type 1 TsaE, partial [Paludibacteraceae bacterium]|nr:tRNA (adenosine(37)-N6)-threonylcarbamoyltransferase complex ATPase subunit type 1 TsaE [Paludibacteraceae bacterium]